MFISSNLLIFGFSSVSLLVTQERIAHWLEGHCTVANIILVGTVVSSRTTLELGLVELKQCAG